MVYLPSIAGVVFNSRILSFNWPLRRVSLMSKCVAACSFAKFRIDCAMRNPLQFIVLLSFSMLIVGCSIQKRSLMPGYYIERVGGQGQYSSETTPSASVEALEEMQWAMAGTLPYDLPTAELNETPYGVHNLVHAGEVRPIPPMPIKVSTSAAELADSAPWDETYQHQKLFGNIALGAFVLSVLLLATSAPLLLVRAVLVSGIVAFILNRRKRREVLDIKELNGYDVTEERKQFIRSNRLLGGAAFVVILTYIVLVILIVLAVIAFFEGLFGLFSW